MCLLQQESSCMRLYVSVISSSQSMKRNIVLFVALFAVIVSAAADKLPKKVEKARLSVTSILAYKDGQLKDDGTAFFVGGNGDVLLSYMLLDEADSAIVIDTKGKVRPVLGIVGLNNIYDCVRVRVAPDKKIPHLVVSHNEVPVGNELYMLAYGKKSSGEVRKVKVSAVDSLYSNAYYTLDIKMQKSYESLPLVNANGELVAIMQPMTSGDTCSYAISSSIYDRLVTTSVTYGRGYYPGMGIRTLLPEDKETALSCMYMQAVVGDSASCGRVVDEFIRAFPESSEGYMSKAEFLALYCRDMEIADAQWDKSLSLAENPAEVYFNKAKTIYTIVQGGDTVSHSMLGIASVLSALDNAIAADNQPLYMNYKADVLLENGRYADAYECYMSLTDASMHKTDIFVRAAQCQGALKNYDAAVELMDSALNTLDEAALRSSSPYILTRALLKSSAGRYREAVFDYNMYENIMDGGLNANFYYLRSQAEVNGKMYQQALNDLEMAISIEPGNATFHLEKGILCYRVGLLEDAAAALESAKGLAADVADIYYLLGCTYLKTGNSRLAEENLQKAVSLQHPDAAKKLKELGK